MFTTFPTTDLTKSEIFPSLLFYYGMLTITATRGVRLVLSIPNNNVRKQYYEFLLEEYQGKRHIDLNNLVNLFDDMAYEDHWRETLEFIAHVYKENSSVHSTMEGERNLQSPMSSHAAASIPFAHRHIVDFLRAVLRFSQQSTPVLPAWYSSTFMQSTPVLPAWYSSTFMQSTPVLPAWYSSTFHISTHLHWERVAALKGQFSFAERLLLAKENAKREYFAIRKY